MNTSKNKNSWYGEQGDSWQTLQIIKMSKQLIIKIN